MARPQGSQRPENGGFCLDLPGARNHRAGRMITTRRVAVKKGDAMKSAATVAALALDAVFRVTRDTGRDMPALAGSRVPVGMPSCDPTEGRVVVRLH